MACVGVSGKSIGPNFLIAAVGLEVVGAAGTSFRPASGAGGALTPESAQRADHAGLAGDVR